MKSRLALLVAAFTVFWLTQPGGAYWRLVGWPWPGPYIVMQLQLGNPSVTLTDGSTSWNLPAEHALGEWNQYLNDVEFRVVRGSTAPIPARLVSNGFNNVWWDRQVFGEPWPNNSALTWHWRQGGATVESDVLFNSNFLWDSYRSSSRRSSDGRLIFDLRRIALHEFGHVLGLDHPDEHGQSVPAIMNSQETQLPALQADDIAGGQSIYGVPPVPNRAPTVTASCNPCSVQTGRTTTLTAAATDPDGDALTYRWSAPEGTFGNSTATSTVWTAPGQPGTVTATVTVQDGRGGTATDAVTLMVVLPDRLQSGSRLLPGQSLTSNGGRYRLLYQSNGDLVLLDDVEGIHVWSTGTAGASAGQAVMQSDGNFVIYDAQGVPVWFTGTGGNANAQLVLQSDGNVVVYSSDGRAVWDQIGASTPTPTPTPTPSPGATSVIREASTSLASRTRRTVTFTTTATGTIGATIDWTFASNDVDIYLSQGTNLCSIDQFNDDECQFLGSTTSASTKPETLSVPNLTAGPYTLYIVNWSFTDDSVGYQITLTTASDASDSSVPSTNLGGIETSRYGSLIGTARRGTSGGRKPAPTIRDLK